MNDTLVDRLVTPIVSGRLGDVDCVALLGPRQVGKSVLANKIAERGHGAIFLDLQSPKDIERLGEPERFFTENAQVLTILDEIQAKPELFPILRAQIDLRRGKYGAARGRFLILGSASLNLRQQASETLAGRISEIVLPGLQLTEVMVNDRTTETIVDQAVPATPEPQQGPREEDLVDTIKRLWNRGGFPLSYLAPNDGVSLRWRRDYIQTYVERDIQNFGIEVDGRHLRRLWELLASRQGGIWNKGSFSSDLGIPAQRVDQCIDILTKLLFVRELRPWFGNIGKRLIKSPRYYIRDSGLVHALLNLEAEDDLINHDISGHSWEGFVVETLINAAKNATDAFFYRTEDGAEIDLVLEFSTTRRWAIEIKFSNDPDIKKGSITAADDMEVERRILVHPGPESFERRGFEALPLVEAIQAVETE